jgi:hypothetical protein
MIFLTANQDFKKIRATAANAHRHRYGGQRWQNNFQVQERHRNYSVKFHLTCSPFGGLFTLLK